ncbi:2Fe-2S iron-sulfur cluster-binding protein [Seohaeicola zhoushanensis]
MKDAGLASLSINGRPVEVASDPGRRLSDVLREELGLRGTKVGCDAGDCGACTVLLDGAPVCACLTPLGRALGREIATVEGGVAEDLQASFLRHGAAQCGICTPGMLMAASALLTRNARPSRGEVEAALGGVLCRCTGYAKIVDAVMATATAAPALPKAGAAVGARVERLDGRPKVDGSESYGADHVPEGRCWCGRSARRMSRRASPWATSRAGPQGTGCRSSPPPTSPARTASARSLPSPTSRPWRATACGCAARRSPSSPARPRWSRRWTSPPSQSTGPRTPACATPTARKAPVRRNCTRTGAAIS